jgi:hypothetical protein
MSTTAIPPPSIEPGLGEPKRITGMFYQPSVTFADVRLRPRWWSPFILMSIFSMIFVLTVDKKIGFTQVQANMYGNMSEKQKDRIEQLPPDQRERQRSIMQKSLKYGSYAAPVFFLIAAAIIALILMAVFNFGLAAEVTFSQSLAIVLYSWIPGLIKTVLAIILVVAGMNPENFNFENPVATNPGMMTSPGDHPALYRLLLSFDVFTIWAVILMGIGFAVVSPKKLKTGTAVGTVFALYAFARLIAVGWAAVMG